MTDISVPPTVSDLLVQMTAVKDHIKRVQHDLNDLDREVVLLTRVTADSIHWRQSQSMASIVEGDAL